MRARSPGSRCTSGPTRAIGVPSPLAASSTAQPVSWLANRTCRTVTAPSNDVDSSKLTDVTLEPRQAAVTPRIHARMPGVATHLPALVNQLLAPVNRAAAAAAALPRTLPAAPGVVLTFDDGPHPEGTLAILELLARHQAPAMFFVVGEQVRRRPALLAQIQAQGHQVGLHGDRHRLQMRSGRNALIDDLRRGTAAIEDALGEPPAWHRPPYGIYSPAGLAATRAAGRGALLGARWGRDWGRAREPRRVPR